MAQGKKRAELGLGGLEEAALSSPYGEGWVDDVHSHRGDDL